MRKLPLYEAIATLVGCTIGAGILGIPYVVAKSGFLIGFIDIVLIGLAVMLINLYLGEVVLINVDKYEPKTISSDFIRNRNFPV